MGMPLRQISHSFETYPNNLHAGFSSQVRNWSELGGEELEIEVWVYPLGDEIHQMVLNNLLIGRPAT